MRRYPVSRACSGGAHIQMKKLSYRESDGCRTDSDVLCAAVCTRTSVSVIEILCKLPNGIIKSTIYPNPDH